MPKQTTDFNSTIAGIPCGILIDHYETIPPWQGNVLNCPSDIDFFGCTKIGYTVLDRKGYPAPWLETKLTPEINHCIETEITNYIKDRR